MVDWSDNGGFSWEDVTFINKYPHRHVNVLGIDNNEISTIPVATVGSLYHTQVGPVIIIVHQYVYNRKGKTTHSSVHIEWYKNVVNEKSKTMNGG